MATWIVHLRMAEGLLTRIPGLDPALFAIGNIAPDSGIPDEKWEKFDPPSEVTHFSSGSNSEVSCADLVFYRQCLLPWRDQVSDAAAFAFRLGYYCHLLTDNLWSIRINQPTRRKFAARFAADQGFIWTVKKDWYGLDFLYVRDHPQSLYWQVFLNCRYDRHDLPFLRLEGVQERIRYIQEYYRSKSAAELAEIEQRPFEYLNRAEMDGFVSSAIETVYNSYQRLWIRGEKFENQVSALHLKG